MGGITLYDVEASLLSLTQARQGIVDSGEDASGIDAEIASCIVQEVKKVSNVRAFILNCEASASATLAESKRLADQAKRLQSDADWLRALTISAMQELGLAEICGRVGRLKLRDNPPHVEIQGAALIPSEYKVHALKVPPEFWPVLSSHNVTAQFPPALRDQWEALIRDAKAEIRLSAIAEELRQPCEECNGNGHRYNPAFAAIEKCPDCGGTGKRGVPGATLERSVRLEVK